MESFAFSATVVSNVYSFKIRGLLPNNEFCIRVREKPVGNKTNLEAIRELAKRFDAFSHMVRGRHSNKKTIVLARPSIGQAHLQRKQN